MGVPIFTYNQFRDRSIEFNGLINKDGMTSTPASGSVTFGLQDTVTGQVAASQTIYTTCIIPIAVSGSLDITSAGLVQGRSYRPFIKKSLNAIVRQPTLAIGIDEIAASGSLVGGDIYVNAGGNGPNHPDGVIFFHRGGTDEGTELRFDHSLTRLTTPLDFQCRDLYLQPDLLGFSNPQITFEDSGGTDGILNYDVLYNRFEFNREVNLQSNKISSVADPTDAQDAATKAYVDAPVGQDLQVSGSMYTTGDIRINAANTPGRLPHLYFSKPASGEEYIWYSNTPGDLGLHASNDFTANGDLKTKGNLYVNYDGLDANSYVYFYEGGSNTGRYLKWDDSSNRFEVNDIFRANGLWSEGTQVGLRLISSDSTYTRADILNTGSGDASLFFDAQDGDVAGSDYAIIRQKDAGPFEFTLGTNAPNWRMDFRDSSVPYLRILRTSPEVRAYGDLAAEGFVSGSEFRANGNLYLNYNGPDGNSYIYFYEGGASNGAFFRFDDGGAYFYTSHPFVVNGYVWAKGGGLYSNANVYVNYDGPNTTSYVYFYNGSATGAYLRRVDSISDYFEFSDQVQMPGATLTADLDMSVNQIKNLAMPSGSFDAANKSYVDSQVGASPATIIALYPNTRLANSWVWNSTDDYIKAATATTTDQWAYVYIDVPDTMSEVVVTGELSLTTTGSEILAARAYLERKTTTGSWTSIANDVDTISIFGGGSQTKALTLTLNGFTLNWADGAQYRVALKRELSSTVGVSVCHYRVYGISVS